MLHSCHALGVLVAVTSLVAAAGCEVQSCKNAEGEDATCLKSLKRYELEDGELRPEPLPYAAGTNVTVHGNYGDIDVLEGTPGEVSVVLEPFVYRAYDAEDAAREELENNFDHSFDEDGDTIVVITDRHDSTNSLGADITLYLPPEFDGALVLENESDGAIDPGDIEAAFVGRATSVELSTESLGDCTVDGEASVVSTRAHCDGTIVVTGVSDEVDLVSSGLGGDILLTLHDIDADSPGGKLESEDGDITVNFPDGASFTVQAAASEDGAVNATDLDAACVGAEAAETAKSYTCGDGGPNYVVTAGKDSVGPSSVELSYEP
jgi:hypothetical protein